MEIRALVQEYGAKVLLDYGCGKGRQFEMTSAALYAKLGVYVENWAEALGVEKIVGYDPAYQPCQTRPTGRFDGVYCCSVLEHIHLDDMDRALRDIFQFAEKFVFFAIGTTPAKKNLPDGRNAHVTIRPLIWWLERISYIGQEFSEIIWTAVEEEEKPING